MPLTRRALLRAGAAAAVAGAAGACGVRPRPTSDLPADVLALHRECEVFDLHVDTLLWMRLLGYDLAARHRNRLPASAYVWHVDLPRARDGGLDGAVMGLVINPREVEPELGADLVWLDRIESGSGLQQTLDTLDLLAETARIHPDELVFARTGTEVRSAVRSGRFAALAGLEGAHGIEDRLENVRTAHERGLRMIGLVHFQRSAAGFPMTVPQFDDRGLTPFGFDLLAEMASLRMVADLAHLNAPGVDDALGALRQPFVVSHSACRALADVPRNLTDDQIRRIGGAGGIVGLAAGRMFIGDDDLAGFLDHAEHVRQIGGADAVAIGTDWDGGITPVSGLEDVTTLPHVTAGLLARGWPEADVRKALGANALRVLTDVCG